MGVGGGVPTTYTWPAIANPPIWGVAPPDLQGGGLGESLRGGGVRARLGGRLRGGNMNALNTDTVWGVFCTSAVPAGS